DAGDTRPPRRFPAGVQCVIMSGVRPRPEKLARARSQRTLVIATALLACRPAPQSERSDEPARAAVPDPQGLARMADEVRDLLLAERVEAARARLAVHLAAAPGDVRLRWLAAAAALADG